MSLNIDQVVCGMGAALRRGEGIYFLGSGISAGSGLPDWLGLLQDIAGPLGLKLTSADELARIAQFCINEDKGNRGPLIGRLRGVLPCYSPRANAYHAAINRTNINTIWTTNFDTLLERSLEQHRIAVRACDADLTSGSREFDIELLKIHGCIDRSRPEEFVLTQEDYEEFTTRRPALSQRLRHDLLHKSFLFAGYSYRDPNIATALVEARRLAQGATREHFFIAMREPSADLARRQELWHDDLRRFGIRTAFITAHSELQTTLNLLALCSRGRSVFITGSHSDCSPVAVEVGKLLAREKDVILLDGQSSGIGREALNAFGEECVAKLEDIRERICYFPNPYSFNPNFANDPSLMGMLKQCRVNLIRAAHSVIVFDGGMGTQAEVELAQEMGCVIVPVIEKARGTGERLLEDLNITKRITSEYVSKAKSRSATAEDIVKCLRETFTA